MGRRGSTITKLPHPLMHPVNSCRGGSLKAGRQQTHAREDATVRSRAKGPTTRICSTEKARRHRRRPLVGPWVEESSCSCWFGQPRTFHHFRCTWRDKQRSRGGGGVKRTNQARRKRWRERGRAAIPRARRTNTRKHAYMLPNHSAVHIPENGPGMSRDRPPPCRSSRSSCCNGGTPSGCSRPIFRPASGIRGTAWSAVRSASWCGGSLRALWGGGRHTR